MKLHEVAKKFGDMTREEQDAWHKNYVAGVTKKNEDEFDQLHTPESKKAALVVKKYTNDYEESDGLDKAADTLLKVLEFKYTGDMYRGIMTEGKDLLKTADVRLMTSKIQQHDRDDKHYLSWSKTIDGVQTALAVNADGGMYDEFEYGVAVVMNQEGVALDIEKMLGGGSVIDPEEEELLAKYQGTPHVVGFSWGFQFYKSNEFNKLVADIKTEFKTN